MLREELPYGFGEAAGNMADKNRKDEAKKLDIALNKLTAISPEIGKLENLVCLDLAFNRISTLPEEFKNLKNLKYLKIIEF